MEICKFVAILSGPSVYLSHLLDTSPPTSRLPQQLSAGGEPETDSTDRLCGGHPGPGIDADVGESDAVAVVLVGAHLLCGYVLGWPN